MRLGINQSLTEIKGLLSLVTCQCLLGFVLMTPNVLQEFCEDETFEADCGSDSVIMVKEARYGRMRLGSCLTINYGSVGCSTDMLQVLDKDCSGRHNCRVNTRDLMVAGKKPCPKDLRNYLEASYRCIPVRTKDVNGECCGRSKEAILTAKSGHIASIITQESECGSIDCPWVIEAEPGQKIHLYLYDFDTYSSELGPNVNADNDFSHTCHVYVIVKEERNSLTACAEGLRERHIYTTDTNRVEIRVVTKKNNIDEAQFMINYTVSGCPNPTKPKGGWIERHEDYILLGCSDDENKETWKLTCKNDKWVGETPNCTSEDDSLTVSGFLDGILSLTPDMSIILICLIALSISIIILSIGVFCIKRKWHHSTTTTKHSHYDLPGNIEGQVISNQSRDQHFIARLEHKNSAAGALADYGMKTYGTNPQKSGYGTSRISRAHTSASNEGQQQDIIVLPEGYRDVNVYGKRPLHQQQHYVEHIYESPTFARKEYSSRDPSESGSSAKYYELETGDTEPLAHMPYETKVSGVSQYPPRYGKPVLPNRVVTASPLVSDTNTHTNTHSSF